MLVKTINLKDSEGKGYLFGGPYYIDYDGRKIKPDMLHRTSEPNDVWRIAEFDLEATMQETLADPDLVHYANDLKNKLYYMRIYDGFVFVLFTVRIVNIIGLKRYATLQSFEMDGDIFAEQFMFGEPKQEDEDTEYCPLYENKERLKAFLKEHHIESD